MARSYRNNRLMIGPMRFTPLGGCGEFGLHSTLLEQDGEAVCIDAGLMFPDEETPGVDFLVPDFQALAGVRAGLTAYFLTHGHEDHVGALAFALEAAPAPVYGAPMTLALARSRLEELGAHKEAELRAISAGETVQVGRFAVTAIAVVHSVPGALGYLIESDNT